MSLSNLMAEIELLHDTHFPDAKYEHCLIKLKKECKELLDNPSEEEFSDTLICLLTAYMQFTGRCGSIRLIEDARKKVAINMQREWIKQPDGTYQHVKDDNCKHCNGGGLVIESMKPFEQRVCFECSGTRKELIEKKVTF